MDITQAAPAFSSLGSTRPAFLLLTPACLLLAFGACAFLEADIALENVALILLAGLAAHISVNTFNEYFDFKSGLDNITQKTPFSGGSGTLPRYPSQANNVLSIAVVSLLSCIAIGLYFVTLVGLELMALGTLGVLLILFYTTHITRLPWLCLIAPGLAFGPIMTLGVGLIFLGEFSMPLVVLSMVPFFLVNNLLLLNQLPDIEADQSVGRMHMPIKMGRVASVKLFALFNLLGLVAVLLAVGLNYFHWMVLIGLIPLLLAIFYSLALLKAPCDDVVLNRVMPLNVAVNLLTPTLIGVSLWVLSP